MTQPEWSPCILMILIGLREATEQRYVGQEKVVNPGEAGGGRGVLVYGADHKMVLHQHQANTCMRTYLLVENIFTLH